MSDASDSSRARRRSKASKLIYGKVDTMQSTIADLQDQMNSMHTKIDLVLGGISLLMDKAGTRDKAFHSFCTPPHTTGHHRDLCIPMDAVPSFPIPSMLGQVPFVPSFPFPAEMEYTPRIDMSHFVENHAEHSHFPVPPIHCFPLDGDVDIAGSEVANIKGFGANAARVAVQSLVVPVNVEDDFLDGSFKQCNDLGGSSHPNTHDAANGSLAFGVNDYVNPGPVGSKDDGTRTFNHDDPCRPDFFLAVPFTNEDGFLDEEENLLECDGNGSGEADSDKDSLLDGKDVKRFIGKRLRVLVDGCFYGGVVKQYVKVWDDTCDKTVWLFLVRHDDGDLERFTKAQVVTYLTSQ